MPRRVRSVILLFVDGVGVGPRDPATNPFAKLPETLLGRFLDEVPDREDQASTRIEPIRLPYGGFWKPIDATLGVPGLPQSATGQATILTGVNAPRRVGSHVSAIPNRKIRDLLEEDNIFQALKRAGRPATFANAYTPAYFARKRPHVSATTRSLMSAGLPLRRREDLLDGRALFHDYTNALLRKRLDHPRPSSGRATSLPSGTEDVFARQARSDPDDEAGGWTISQRSAADAADILFVLARDHDFTLHEHFLTDLAGHRGTDEERVEAAKRIEALAGELARGADQHEVLVLMVSDHGNLEDSTVRTHTLNPVPFLAWGPGAKETIFRATDLTHVTPSILESLGL